MKNLLMITLLLLGGFMFAENLTAKIPIEGGFGIKLGDKLTPALLETLRSTGKKDRTGRIMVYPVDTKKTNRNLYFVSTNKDGLIYEIFCITHINPVDFGAQWYKVFCIRYGKTPDERVICYKDPQNSNRFLHLVRLPTSTKITYYDKGLSDREKTE